ncbi:MAG: FecR domain-containing protein [Pseudomonadota bacterium]
MTAEPTPLRPDDNLEYRAEREDLAGWLDDAANRSEFFDQVRLWDKMNAMARLADIVPQHNEVRRGRVWLAASLLLATAAAFVGFFVAARDDVPDVAGQYETSPAGQRYATPVGNYRLFELADGSRLTLNTDSSARFRIGAGYRVLLLERGEAHIDAAHDATRPFTVYAGSQVLQALGTAFNVELSADRSVELTVTEGMVLATARAGATTAVNAVPPRLHRASARMVSAGEGLRLGVADEAVAALAPADIEARLSWRAGNLIFRGDSLSDAIAEISRYTTVEFVFADPSIERVEVAGLYKAGDIDGLLLALQENFNIAHRRVDENTILLGPQ